MSALKLRVRNSILTYEIANFNSRRLARIFFLQKKRRRQFSTIAVKSKIKNVRVNDSASHVRIFSFSHRRCYRSFISIQFHPIQFNSFHFFQVPLLFASAGILATTFTICVFIKWVPICGISLIYLCHVVSFAQFNNRIHALYLSSFFLHPFFSLSRFPYDRFNHTPVIMASGRELCYVLLTGVCLCYVMTFIILARPTVIRCACLRVGLGLCLSLCYSAIFVKTNRISRIFNCGVKAVSRPIYTSPISQIAICLCTWESIFLSALLFPFHFFSVFLFFFVLLLPIHFGCGPF